MGYYRYLKENVLNTFWDLIYERDDIEKKNHSTSKHPVNCQIVIYEMQVVFEIQY